MYAITSDEVSHEIDTDTMRVIYVLINGCSSTIATGDILDPEYEFLQVKRLHEVVIGS